MVVEPGIVEPRVILLVSTIRLLLTTRLLVVVIKQSAENHHEYYQRHMLKFMLLINFAGKYKAIICNYQMLSTLQKVKTLNTQNDIIQYSREEKFILLNENDL